MKVGLIQVDGKMPNLALMKLSRYHKNKGDDVRIIDLSSLRIDKWYGSKIFMGGSGYDIKSKLPESIECLVPDYEKFNVDYSIGFSSRGCIRNCKFCIVSEKEGKIREVDMDWIKHSKVILLDNNFLASPKWKEKLQHFIDNKIKVNFNQGLDIRLITEENAEVLAKVKYYDRNFIKRRIYFAWDDMKYEKAVRKGIKTLINAGIKPSHLMFYILVGYNSTHKEDMKRFEIIREYGADPYIQIYNNRKDDKWIRNFARWVNKRLYKVCEFKDYKRNKR